MIQLAETYADEKAVHLLLDFQSANLATEAAAGVPRPTILSPDSGSGLDSGLGSESTLASRSASTSSSLSPPVTSPLATQGLSLSHSISPGISGSGSDSRHGSSLSSLPSASASVSPSPSPSRDLSLASAGLDRLLPVLRLAHRYEFPVQGEILLAITEALGSTRTAAQDTLATFVTAAELGSPDLAHAAVRAMSRGDAGAYCPLSWDAGTFAAVPKEYHWALQRCFVAAGAGAESDSSGIEGSGGAGGDGSSGGNGGTGGTGGIGVPSGYVIDEERFVPALFDYRAVTAQQGGAQN